MNTRTLSLAGFALACITPLLAQELPKLQKAVGTDAAVIVAVAKIGYRYLGQTSAVVHS